MNESNSYNQKTSTDLNNFIIEKTYKEIFRDIVLLFLLSLISLFKQEHKSCNFAASPLSVVSCIIYQRLFIYEYLRSIA